MMRKAISAIVGFVVLSGGIVPAPAYTLQYRDSSGVLARRWVANPIIIAFSSSLNSPPPNIKTGSDVVGAAHRAVQHWAAVAKIQFIETTSSIQNISAQNLGDGVNVISVSNDNASAFGLSESPGRTRVFYDSGGAIVEADIALNPNQLFSSDGTTGTYDLEATFTHEVGHLIGLEHSAVIGATMQPRQAKNGLFNLPAFTQRTLSDDDCAGVRALYGSRISSGSISGRLIANGANSGPQQAVFGAQVFAENLSTGKVVASDITLPTGDYHIEGLTPGSYRVIGQSLMGPIAAADIAPHGGSYSGLNATTPLFRTFEGSASVPEQSINANGNSGPSTGSFVSLNSAPSLQAHVIGLNGQLSTVAVPLAPGNTSTVFVGGRGVDQILAAGISVSSPFVTIKRSSLALEEFDTPYPVISFDVIVAPNAQAGDYSIRLQSSGGETAYLAGAITIDPGVTASTYPNAADDPHFFVRQHYHDFLGREPDAAGLDYWASQIEQCGNDVSCIRAQRIHVSAAFFVGSEFQQTGSFVYRLYKSALGRQPGFVEFAEDRSQVIGGADLDSRRRSLALAFMQRREFVLRYPQSMTADQFVDALLASIKQSSDIDLSRSRRSLMALYDETDMGRAAILQEAADNPAFIQAEYNRAFVLMQYFGYLRRDVDRGGYDFWLNTLNTRWPSDSAGYRAMVCAFLTSAEYQLRFGIAPAHTNGECGP
jgi:Matrixin/Domain of unknown function (DUF4214)